MEPEPAGAAYFCLEPEPEPTQVGQSQSRSRLRDFSDLEPEPEPLKKVAAPQHCVQANVMLKSEGLYIFQTLKSKLYYRRYMDRNASFLFRWNKASP